MIKSSFFDDTSQNFWHLASIQGASAGITGLVIGGQLKEQLGAPTALLSIIIGNLILWVIGIGMLSMSVSKSNPVVDNIIRYFGRWSGFFSSVIITAVFLLWYIVQINASNTAIKNVVRFAISENFELYLGVIVSVVVTLLAMAGIRLIKWICLFAFPFILSSTIYTFLYFKDKVSFQTDWKISLIGIAIVVLTMLMCLINLPTFFRHARSKADSFIGLTLTILFTALIECSGIWLRYDRANHNLTQFLRSDFNYVYTVLVVLVSCICVNLVNLYFASAGVEAILSRFSRLSKYRAFEYGILGLLGTVLFVIVQVSLPMLFLINDFIANLGIVLMLGFLVSLVIKHRRRAFEKAINNACWLVGCVVSLLVQLHYPEDSNLAFGYGIGAGMLAFLIAAFCAETVWSVREIRSSDS